MPSTRTALVLGGAYSLHLDLDRLMLPFDMVVACNDAGAQWPGHLDAWVSLHPNKFATWEKQRAEAGFPKCDHLVGFGQRSNGPPVHRSTYLFPGTSKTASSGFFAAKYALIDLGADRVVLCGVPLDQAPHFFDATNWRGAENFHAGALQIAAGYPASIRSMSGWTRVLFGSPADWEREHARSEHERA